MNSKFAENCQLCIDQNQLEMRAKSGEQCQEKRKKIKMKKLQLFLSMFLKTNADFFSCQTSISFKTLQKKLISVLKWLRKERKHSLSIRMKHFCWLKMEFILVDHFAENTETDPFPFWVPSYMMCCCFAFWQQSTIDFTQLTRSASTRPMIFNK